MFQRKRMRNKRKNRKSTSDTNKLELYERASFFIRIGNNAVHGVQEENRKLGLPNVYGMNGKAFFEMPDGEIVTKSPWGKISRKSH